MCPFSSSPLYQNEEFLDVSLCNVPNPCIIIIIHDIPTSINACGYIGIYICI